MVLPGYKRWTLLPMPLLVPVERILAAIPGINRFSKNQIFVCEKRLAD
jgi:hypothetical protein